MSKRIIVLCFVFLALADLNVGAARVILPVKEARMELPVKGRGIFSLKLRQVQKLIGKKLSLRQKVAWTILAHKLAKQQPANPTDKGQLALIFGIVGISAIIIPYAGLISLPCALAAIIIGYNARRDNPSNRKARAAIVLGWVTIGILVLALLLVIAVLATFAWY
jgi:sterol desaturase/sphingolipid hydroxylase (fatty acid hydroxylase superfamily)